MSCSPGFVLGNRFMLKFFSSLGVLFIFCSCSTVPNLPSISNPFPASGVRDAELERSFLELATDSRLLAFQLVDVRKGSLEPGRSYEVPFIAPKGTQMILVSDCGTGCTSTSLNLLDSEGMAKGSVARNDGKSYVSINVGTNSTAYVSQVSIDSCLARTCTTYWALYARSRP